MYKTEGFEIRRGAVPLDLSNFLHKYLVLKAKASRDLWDKGHSILGWGRFDDPQMPNTWSNYADTAMEVLLSDTKSILEGITGEALIPTYSYVRVYKKGDILERHIDRPSCAISCTLNIGGDPWGIHIKDYEGNEHSTILNPGDLLTYRGDKLEHWREAFEGNVCSQVFLHYNPISEGEQNLYDGRSGIGMMPSNL